MGAAIAMSSAAVSSKGVKSQQNPKLLNLVSEGLLDWIDPRPGKAFFPRWRESALFCFGALGDVGERMDFIIRIFYF